MSRTPISKLAKDKAALAFLKKHHNDPIIGGGFSAATPYNNFPRVLDFKRKRVVDAIVEVLDALKPHERQLMELFLQMPPRKIAQHLQKPRSWVYSRVRHVRDKCLKLAAKKRGGYIDQRAEDQSERPECAPATIATRTLVLTLGGVTRQAHYLERSGKWSDDEGNLFSDEICDILDNYQEDIGDDSPLEVEEY